MLPLRAALCQSENLGKAFMHYRRHHGLWATGTPMCSVTESPVVPMLELAEELRTDSYRPSMPHTFSIAKANGEQRELRVFSIRDRVAQRALLQVLQMHTESEMSPVSYGYRPGRGAVRAVAQVRTFLNDGLSWVVDADIERCFDSIPRDLLLEEVARRLHTAEAADLIAQFMGWDEIEHSHRIGIPQGAVLSPWLCNVYLWRLDDAMREVAMVRFADDFVLLNASRAMAESMRDRCAEVIGQMRLRLHPLKTAILDAAQPFRFLGQWLSTPSSTTEPTPVVGGCP